MRRGAERRQGRAAGLDADPPVFRQIIIDKYPAARQYVRFLLQNNMTHASVTSAAPRVHTLRVTKLLGVANVHEEKNYPRHSKTNKVLYIINYSVLFYY